MVYGLYEYPNRVTRQEDGAFRWRCTVDKEYEHRGYRAGIIACIWIGLFILLFGVFLAYRYRDPVAMLAVVGSDAIFALICFGVFWAAYHLPGETREIYEMRDDYIKSGSGKTTVYFNYKKARVLTVSRNYVELKGKIASPRFYVPEEDMSIVKGHIMSRIPGDAEIRYE